MARALERVLPDRFLLKLVGLNNIGIFSLQIEFQFCRMHILLKYLHFVVFDPNVITGRKWTEY